MERRNQVSYERGSAPIKRSDGTKRDLFHLNDNYGASRESLCVLCNQQVFPISLRSPVACFLFRGDFNDRGWARVCASVWKPKHDGGANMAERGKLRLISEIGLRQGM